MDSKKPIFWHQGLFLQPQHFQLSDLYAGFLQRPFADLGLPHFWGVGALELSAAAVKNLSVE
ncbi:MAG: type VI secretion system baseplate subunit TssK, partial [Nitrospirota bacterium]|nr:type VI secretion system baseplate subunit TssK [Nitrospirota bacterium]